MPNGRGHYYHTASMTVVGVGDQGTSVLESLSDQSSDDERVNPNKFLSIKLSDEGGDANSPDPFQMVQIDASTTYENNTKKRYLEPVKMKEPSPPDSAPVIRHYLNSKTNFLPVFEQIESGVVSDAKDDPGSGHTPNLHLNLFVGDISEPIVRGVLPIVGKILQDASDAVEIPAVTAGVLLSPTCPVDSDESIEPIYRRAYIGLRETITLLINHNLTDERSISTQPGTIPSGKTNIDLSERLFDFFGILGYHPDSETPDDPAAKGAFVLSVLFNSPLFTGGHGVLHLPGIGWKAHSPPEVRLPSNEQLTTTPVPWIESPYIRRKIDEMTAERLWLEEDKRTIPIDYPDEYPSEKEEDQFIDRDIGVYELAPEGSTDEINKIPMSIEQYGFNDSVRVSTRDTFEGFEPEYDRRYVVFHPDVDPFAVSPYSELHERYADDLHSLVTGLSPYPLAYPELVDMDNYTIKP